MGTERPMVVICFQISIFAESYTPNFDNALSSDKL